MLAAVLLAQAVPVTLASAAACSGAGIVVARVSSPVLYLDTTITPQQLGGYAGYEITAAAPVDDLWVRVENMAGGVVALGAYEDGQVQFGPVAGGGSGHVYFYLTATAETSTPQTHDVVLYDGPPALGGSPICEEAFALTTEDTIKAAANKVNTVVAGPNPAELGGLMTMTVTGNTGTIGAAGIFAATPAVDPAWPANAYELTGVELTLGSDPPLYDVLYLSGLGKKAQDYEIVYSFVAIGTTAAPTAVNPVNHISSGTQVKHTDTSGFADLAPILPTENKITLSKAVDQASLPTTGGTVEYTVTVANAGALPVSLGDLVDVLPSGTLYKPGTSSYDGGPIGDPIIVGGALNFVGPWTVPAGGSAALVYEVDLPAVPGPYANTAVGHVGTAQIDTTLDTSDNAPAAATTWVGPLPSADLSVTVTDSPDPVVEGSTATLTVTVHNNGPADAASVTATIALPLELGYLSAVPDQGSCSEAGGAITCTLGDMPPGSDAVITVSAQADVVGSAGTTAAVTAVTSDPDPADNSAAETTTIVPANSPPVAGDDVVVVAEDGSVSFDPLGNDLDPEGGLDASSVTVVSGPADGAVAVDAVTGAVTYTPDPDFFGTDTFTYQVCDVGGACDTATVSVTVDPVPDVPVAADDGAVVAEDVSVVVDVVGNDTDVDGDLDPGSVTVTSGPADGTVAVDPVTGAVTYTPDPDFFGSDTFTYRVCDLAGGCDTAAVAMTVTPVNDVPVAGDDVVVVAEDGSVSFDPLGNDSDPEGGLDASSVTVVSGPADGAVAVDAVTGAVTYTPDPDFFGTDTFTYQVCDVGGACDTATVTVTVGAVNDPPAIRDDPVTTNEDTPVVVDVLANDTDFDGALDPVSVTVTSAPADGMVAVDPLTGAVTYTPDPDFFGTDTFTYQACDTGSPALCDVASVVVGVGAVNDPPVAGNDAAALAEDGTASVDVLANDSDMEAALDPTTVTVVSGPTDGTAGVDPSTGAITYTPAPDFNGVDVLTYQVCDTAGACDNATVVFTVNAIDDAPVAGDDAATIFEDDSVAIDVTANDVDADDPIDPTSVEIIAGPTNGSAAVDPVTGAVTYTPDPDFNGTDTFTYQLCDGAGLCDAADVTVTVAAAPDAPIAVDDAVSVLEATAAVITVLANDADADGDIDVTSVTIVAAPSGGTAVADPDSGIVTYTPDPGFSGPDSLAYQVCDATVPVALCDVATVDITVDPVELPPSAEADAGTTTEDVPIVVDVLANDADPNGNLDPATLTIGSGPAQGSTTIDPATGEITYTPIRDFNGTDSFTYQVCDTVGGCDAATVLVTVTAVNDAPVALPDSAETGEDTPVTVDVVANDFDIDGNLDPGSVTIVSPPSSGTVAVDPVTGAVTYTPAVDFAGGDSFGYEVCDFGVPSLCSVGTAIVATAVVEVNDAPEAVDDSATVAEDGSATFDILGNDTDLEGSIDPSTLTIIAGPGHGTIGVDPATGVVSYTPAPDYSGSDSFTYQVCDDGSPVLCDVAEVTIDVTASNDAPIALPDTAETAEDTPVTVDVVANDSDVDGNLDPGSVVLTSGPAHGSATVDPITGAITYSPATNYVGSDVFTYEVCDTGTPRQCSTGAVAVTASVLEVNDPPVVVDDAAIVEEGTPTAIGVLDNDLDADGALDPATVSILTNPADGSVNVDPVTGLVTYEPAPGFVGPDGFTYQVCDTGVPSLCGVGQVTVMVNPMNDPPAILNDAAAVSEDGSVAVPVLVNDSDPDGSLDASSLAVIVAPDHGSASVDLPSSTVMYAPERDFYGVDTFTYLVCDDGGACRQASVTVTVVAVNDAPVVNDDSAATNGGSVSVPVLANDVDVEGNLDPGSLVIVTEPEHGTANVTGSAITYLAAPGHVGADSFVYEVCDSSDACGTGAVSITVGPATPSSPPDDEPPSDQPPTDVPGPLAAAGPVPVLSGNNEIHVPLDGTPDRLVVEVGAGHVARFTVVGGTLPPGLGLLPDGTWHGTMLVAGRWLLEVEACDDQAPPACALFSITLTSELLPQTGMEAAGFVRVGLSALLLGLALLAVGRLPVRRRA